MSDAAVDLSAVAAGLIAYALALGLATLLVFLTYRISARTTAHLDTEALLREGHRSAGVVLGSVLLSQAILMRHAVYPVMAVVRELFLSPPTIADVALTLGRSLLFVATVAALSVGSVLVAGWLFTRLTGSLDEHAEIEKDNLAVAIFFAFAVLSITLVVDQGMDDLARSLVPWGRSGVVRLR